jgi:hypothetical protein
LLLLVGDNQLLEARAAVKSALKRNVMDSIYWVIAGGATEHQRPAGDYEKVSSSET